MPTQHETVVFDVHDCKVYKLLTDNAGSSPTYSSAVDVPGIAEVSLDPNLLTAELKGDAKVIAKKGRIDKVNLSATYGKLALDVLGVVLGGTNTDQAGSARWRLAGTNSLPYFKIVFVINDADVGQVKVTLYKAQVTGGTLLGQSSDQFGQPTMQVEGIPALGDDNYFIDIELLDVAEVL